MSTGYQQSQTRKVMTVSRKLPNHPNTNLTLFCDDKEILLKILRDYILGKFDVSFFYHFLLFPGLSKKILKALNNDIYIAAAFIVYLKPYFFTFYSTHLKERNWGEW